MKSLALALALALLAPGVTAKASEPDYPDEFLALVPGWIAEAEALATPEDKTKEWYAEADSFLQKAKEAHAAGRLRVAMFDIETYRELVIAHQLVDASAAEGSDAERRTYVSSRTAATKGDAEAEWASFRAALHAYDGEVRSLQTIEKVLYAGDVALIGALGLVEYDTVAREFPKQPGVPFGYVHALVRDSSTPLVNAQWGKAMLAEAAKEEGLPPRVLDEPWANLTRAAVQVPEGDVQPYLESLEKLAAPARANNESLLAIVMALAEQRSTRAYGMQTIFGDASTRGLDVVNDAARGMNKQLNNTTLETPRSYGLVGVFTSDAIDRAQYTNEFLRESKADLGTVIVAWSGLEHATYVLAALASASPVTPPPTPTGEDAPAAGLVLSIGVLAAVAFVLRRR